MNHRKAIHFMSAGAAILGLALSIPSAMLAQNDSSGMNAPQSNSQDSMGMHHRNRAKRQLQHLTKSLNLTPEQQQQILPILQNQNQQMRTMHQNTSLTSEQRHEQMRTLMQDTRQKMEAVLNDTQRQQFEQMMQQRRQRWNQNGGNRGPGAGAPPSADAGTPPPAPPQ